MAMDNQQKSATLVYRAGTKQGPSFDLNDESIEKVWLVTSPELFFPLGQDLPVSKKKCLEGVCLWTTDVSNLSKDFICYPKHDGVIQVELNDSKDPVKKIHTALSSLKWDMTTVPKCKGGLSLMNLSPLVQAVKKYMKDHYPNSAKELNFHAELKAASQWCLPDDYEQLVMKKVPVGDCRLEIAVTSTLETWEEKVKELQMNKPTNIDEDNDSSDECVDEKLSDYREAIGVLKIYLEEGRPTGSDTEDMEWIVERGTSPGKPPGKPPGKSPGKNHLVPKDIRFGEFQQPPKVAALKGAMAPALHANFMEEHPSAAGTKLLKNESPRKKKHEANGDGTVPAKRVKPAQRRVSPRLQPKTVPVMV